MVYRRTDTLALALPPRLLFTVTLPGLLATRKLPLPFDGKVPMSVLVAILQTVSVALAPAELLVSNWSLLLEVE
jgi:hypothetical protein